MTGKHAHAALFFMLFLSSIAFAACPTATRNIYLAAVTGESTGGIFQLQLEVRPGNGTIYTSISPRTGFATQESELDAVKYAFASSGVPLSECDVLFQMKGMFGDNTVDGPSAGAAMALATKAALQNRAIRQDVAMTGTISSDGKVGPVGGIIEKALAAADSGAKYFVVPKLQVYEALLLSSVSRTRDFSAIEAGSLSDAEAVLLSNYSSKFNSSFNPQSKPIPQSLAKLPLDEQTGRFSIVAGRVVDALDEKVRRVFQGRSSTTESERLSQYFAAEISKYRKLLAMGYPFTSANSAFLLSIDAEYAKIGINQVDINGSFEDVSSCVSSLEKPEKTTGNFHWAIGSDLRRIWAEKKLNETAGSRSDHGGYVTLRDLLFANSWCGISKELSAQADDIGGEKANESALAALASEKLAEAEATLSSATTPDYDALWHYEGGLIANSSGNYGAAIYEATYAATMQKVTSEERDNVSAAALKLSAGGRNSLWGKIYYAQGLYLYAEANDSKTSPSDAYRILKYSSELDKAAAEIDRELGSAPGIQQPAQKQEAKSEPTGLDQALSLLLALCLALVGIGAVYRLSRKKSGK